jgi:hypothetical protein
MLRDISISHDDSEIEIIADLFLLLRPHISINDREEEMERENIIKTTTKMSKILESKIAYIAIFENLPGYSIVKFMGILLLALLLLEMAHSRKFFNCLHCRVIENAFAYFIFYCYWHWKHNRKMPWVREKFSFIDLCYRIRK